jgi:hypothetical protein
MTKRLLLTGTILLLVVGAIIAADGLGGKWSMSQEASNGGPPRVTTFDLTVEGSTVTGTVTAPMGGRGGGDAAPVAIANGKVNGKTLTFEVVRTFAGKPATTRYECTVSGDTMHVKQTVDLGKGPQTVEGNAKRT